MPSRRDTLRAAMPLRCCYADASMFDAADAIDAAIAAIAAIFFAACCFTMPYAYGLLPMPDDTPPADCTPPCAAAAAMLDATLRYFAAMRH